jgi:glycosyltransferase involved in cell wall biosynthesis
MDAVATPTSAQTRRSEMHGRPQVSVIMIFLNTERFIQEAIESVFAQSYDAWELLLVDDGSTDTSSAIARGYAEQHPGQVRYFEHAGRQNRGMSASRNLGIRNATGEYIAFLDADDIWLPHKLEQQVAILGAWPEAAMVYGLSQWWYSWTGKPEDSHRDYVHDLGVAPNTLIEPPMLLCSFFLKQSAAIPSPSSILVRREVIERIGGFEEVFRGEYEDQAFYAKVCLAAPVFASNECWNRYRQHPDSCGSAVQKTGREYAARRVFLNWLAAYLSSRGIKDPELWQALQREQWRCRYPALDRLLRRRRQLVRRMETPLRLIARHALPAPIRHWLSARWNGQIYSPPRGWVRFGNLRRVTPLSREFGYDRGLPIDRYYIERFLSAHALDIRGHVLEIADDAYTRQFGGDRVTSSEVLHVTKGDSKATIVADLTDAHHIPSTSFDCVILTQTLQFIYDVRAALATIYRILKPGGVVLATVPGISQISQYDMEQWGHFWSFTTLSARRLFGEAFRGSHVTVEAYGNVLAATAFLQGLATQELKQKELDHRDPDYEVVITVRAVKSSAGR